MPKALVVTVGTGQTRKDIAQALVFAIRQHNPDHVLFIATAKSQAETLPLVLGDAAVCGRHHDVAMVADEDDFEAICQQCRDLIRALASRGFGPGQLVADYTSGTKAMSAGLCLAAVDEGLDAISYIAGKRGDGGRVISGTERLITARPGLTQATRHLEAAIQYFNTYQFSAARAALERALAATADPEVTQRAQWLLTLVEAYSTWDRFDLSTALENLKPAADSPLCLLYGLKNPIELNKQALFQEVQKPICPERGADLLQNARRRAEEGKYDDATARLYRLLEYLSEFQLQTRHGLDSSDLKPEKLPDALRPQYETLRRGGRIELGLRQAYQLLADLGDEFGRKAEAKEFKVALAARNDSILAHGFAPMGKAGYEKCHSVASECARTLWPHLDDLTRRVEFPKLRKAGKT